MLVKLLKKDPVLWTAAFAAVLSAFFVPPSLKYLDYIDLRTLSLLLSLMIAVGGMSQSGAFAALVHKMLAFAKSTRLLCACLVLLCFFSSMVITNDVALITFVPFAILALMTAGERVLLIPVIVLQTVAANLGSMLTPLGNPQNLYLYSLSGLSLGAFLKIMLPLWALSLFLLLLCLPVIPSRPLRPIEERGQP